MRKLIKGKTAVYLAVILLALVLGSNVHSYWGQHTNGGLYFDFLGNAYGVELYGDPGFFIAPIE